jgi:hypothetical protein
MTAEQLAKLFHTTYERLAPDFNYQTRKASAVAWEDVPDNNKRLMIAVAGEVLTALTVARTGGFAIVGEPGPEVYTLPEDSSIYPTHTVFIDPSIVASGATKIPFNVRIPEPVEESPLSGMALAVEAIREMIVDEIAKSEERIVQRVLEELHKLDPRAKYD